MKLMSVDANTKQTGFVVWEHGAPTHRHTLTASTMDGMMRQLHDALTHIAPDAVATEAAYLDRNVRTYGILSQLIGMLRGWCVVRGVPLYVLTTTEIDRMTGVGGDRKAGNRALAAHELTELCRSVRLDEHQCDAYAIGVAALGCIKSGEWAAQDNEAA
jgi:Holliday junction resolvasome RuvABC endonuclease subunit